uniref:Uncharacterized protein n=1 Tax=Parascaris univalens TaxID=6257 RepID=A0A915CIH4_PARUN
MEMMMTQRGAVGGGSMDGVWPARKKSPTSRCARMKIVVEWLSRELNWSSGGEHDWRRATGDLRSVLVEFVCKIEPGDTCRGVLARVGTIVSVRGGGVNQRIGPGSLACGPDRAFEAVGRVTGDVSDRVWRPVTESPEKDLRESLKGLREWRWRPSTLCTLKDAVHGAVKVLNAVEKGRGVPVTWCEVFSMRCATIELYAPERKALARMELNVVQ